MADIGESSYERKKRLQREKRATVSAQKAAEQEKELASRAERQGVSPQVLRESDAIRHQDELTQRHREQQAAYQQTPFGRETAARHRQTPKGKATQTRVRNDFLQTPKGQDYLSRRNARKREIRAGRKGIPGEGPAPPRYRLPWLIRSERPEVDVAAEQRSYTPQDDVNAAQRPDVDVAAEQRPYTPQGDLSAAQRNRERIAAEKEKRIPRGPKVHIWWRKLGG